MPLHDFALLIVAHAAGNGGVAQLAAELARRNVAGEIGVGFIKGIPAIDEMLRALASPTVLVYPLFLSDGYFNRVRLPQLLAKARVPRAVRLPGATCVVEPVPCFDDAPPGQGQAQPLPPTGHEN